MRWEPGHYRERLTPPWWAWVAVPAGLALLQTELAIGLPVLSTWPAYAGCVAVGLAILVAVGRLRVAVAPAAGGGVLTVDDAVLPLSVVREVSVVDAAGRRDLLGPGVDPLAFVIQRPWVAGGVRIDLDDPDDPTPYWFVSSRHPQELATALVGAPRA